nr:hypothetical protein [Tanacetum cinerariifolium]
MAEMFGLLKELTSRMTPKKVLVREEARHPITKNVNAISLIKMEKEKSAKNNEEEMEDGTNDESSRSTKEELTRWETNAKVVETLGIVKDVLVEITGYVYPVDFVILDIKEDEKKPFILGMPFLTTAKVKIIFEKGTITIKSCKNKINFFKIPESPCRVEEETENDIDLVAPTNIVSRLILEWEERIKEEINNRMAEIFGLLKELTSRMTPKKVLVREEDRHPITKNVNAISLIKMEKEKSAENNEEEMEDGTNDESSRSMKEELTRWETNAKVVETLGIVKDVLVEITGYVYPVDFVILDIKEDEKKPFILGMPFLTQRLKVEEETENDIDLVAPTNIVSRIILEWEERIKYHKEKEMGFNQ